MDQQQQGEMLARIDERTERMSQDFEKYCDKSRVDFKELFEEVGAINKQQLPEKIEGVKNEIKEHKQNHWAAYGVVLGVVGIIITLFEVFRNGR